MGVVKWKQEKEKENINEKGYDINKIVVKAEEHCLFFFKLNIIFYCYNQRLCDVALLLLYTISFFGICLFYIHQTNE